MDSLHDHRFFFEVRPIEELQDPKISPRREEVGRRTLGAFGGFLARFFYRASFVLFTQARAAKSTRQAVENSNKQSGILVRSWEVILRAPGRVLSCVGSEASKKVGNGTSKQ